MYCRQSDHLNDAGTYDTLSRRIGSGRHRSHLRGSMYLKREGHEVCMEVCTWEKRKVGEKKQSLDAEVERLIR
jgi:hypothetical protein